MRRVGFLLLAAACWSAPAWAQDSIDTLRCGSNLVTLGMTKADVLAQCGRPDMQQVVGEKIVRTNQGVEKQLQEEWIYNFGKYDFVHTLCFEGGKLSAIVRGGRGK